MINFIKTIVKSNRILIIIAEKISTNLKINFETEYKIAAFLNRPLIIDIGAHMGESIKAFKKFSPDSEIISFEPNFKLFKKIKKIEKSNKNVKVYNYAISNSKIKYLFIPKIFGFELSLWSTFSKKYLEKRWSEFTDIKYKNLSIIKIKIKSKKLDNFNLNPKIIKIDAEGSEFQIIKSAKKTIRKNLPILIIEFHHENFFDIKKFLHKMGYLDYLFIKKKNILIKINKQRYAKIQKKTTSTNIIFYSKKSKLLNKFYFN